MILPPVPSNEKERLESLRNYALLDTAPEQEYDEITFLASNICDCPISLISLIDEQRVWFKSHQGVQERSAPREISFCAHAIAQQDKMMIVNDARLDERFADNPLVTGETQLIFYAGIPLITEDGYALGTLCVLDHHPKTLSEKQLTSLQYLSHQVLRLFEARKLTFLLRKRLLDLEITNKGLDEFARIAAHDIKSPLNNLVLLSDLLQENLKIKNFEAASTNIGMLKQMSFRLGKMIDGILEYSRNITRISEFKTEFFISAAVNEILSLFNPAEKQCIIIDMPQELTLFTNRAAFDQIIMNLLTNALRYNDKPHPEIIIKAQKLSKEVVMNVIDNGSGIKPEDTERIFGLFEIVEKDNKGKTGTGIGLATVRSLITQLGGTISVKSEIGKGSDFEIHFPL